MAINVSKGDKFIMGGFPGKLTPLDDNVATAALFADLRRFVMVEVTLPPSLFLIFNSMCKFPKPNNRCNPKE
jgi:hypothetical protein